MNFVKEFTVWILTVGNGNVFSFNTLVDSVRFVSATGGVDEFSGESFLDGADRLEGLLTSTGGDEGDGLGNTTERRNINGSTTDGTTRTDTGGVFTGTSVFDSLNEDLDRVFLGAKVDDIESLFDDTSGHDLLTGVTTVHHESVSEAFNDGALTLVETLLLPATSGVGKGGDVGNGNVVLKGDIFTDNLRGVPLTEEKHFYLFS